jgi:hypothetical protein
MKDLKDFHNSLESKINIQNNIDNFAIEFVNWLLIEPLDNSMENCTTKELLQIFKEQRR